MWLKFRFAGNNFDSFIYDDKLMYMYVYIHIDKYIYLFISVLICVCAYYIYKYVYAQSAHIYKYMCFSFKIIRFLFKQLIGKITLDDTKITTSERMYKILLF